MHMALQCHASGRAPKLQPVNTSISEAECVQIMNPKSRKVEVEIDGAATCQEANLVVEDKSHLGPKDVIDFLSRIDSLE